ncbi:MAG: alpha/beta hydrolase [Pseudonocardia sp.]|nr:alpha/beta hydrolase [Pseudonocardia sp.]
MPADRPPHDGAATPYGEIVARTPVDATTLDVRGTRTRVWRYGAAEPRATLLFLHGLRGEHHGLEPIVAYLVAADPSLRVLVPDLPGFGATPVLPHDTHDVAGYAGWTRELLDLAGGDVGADVVLAGHSFGSIVAAATVAGDAAGIGALVLVSPIAAAPLRGPRAAMRRLTSIYHRVAGAVPAAAGEAMLRNRLVTWIATVAMTTTTDPELRNWIHAEHGRYFAGFAGRDSLLEAFTASVSHTVTGYAPEVKVPTLLVAGELDTLAPPAAQRALRPLFPDARLVMLPGTGHLAHYEQPAVVAAAIAAEIQ